MKWFLRFLLPVVLFNRFVVDNDGAGASDNDDKDVGDIEVTLDDDKNDDSDNNDTTDNTSDENSNNIVSESLKKIRQLEKIVEKLQADKEARETEIATNLAIQELQAKHKGFDSNKVKEYLVELNKTDPQRANSLNNPIGWENIWLNEFASLAVENDIPSFGRNIEPVDRSEEVLEKLKNGEVIGVNDELEFYGDLL